MKHLDKDVIKSMKRIDSVVSQLCKGKKLNETTVEFMRNDLAKIIAYFETTFMAIESIISNSSNKNKENIN